MKPFLSILFILVIIIDSSSQQFIALFEDVPTNKSGSTESLIKLNNEVLNAFVRAKGDFKTKLSGDTVFFSKIEFRAANFRIVDGNGIEYRSSDRSQYYIGEKTKAKSAANFAMIITGEDLELLEFRKDGIHRLTKSKNGAYKFKLLEQDKNTRSINNSLCGVESNILSDSLSHDQNFDNINMPRPHIELDKELKYLQKRNPSLSDNCIPVAFDISYDIYEIFGSVDKVERWFMATFFHVAQVYKKHDINLTLTELRIYTSQSQDLLYNISNTNEMLRVYPTLFGLGYNFHVGNQIDWNHLWNTDIGPKGTSMRQYLFHYPTRIGSDAYGRAYADFQIGWTERCGPFNLFTCGHTSYFKWVVGTPMALSVAGPINDLKDLQHALANSDGTVNTNGQVYTAQNIDLTIGYSYVIAHELGHNFGAIHEHEEILPFQPKINNCAIDSMRTSEAYYTIGGIMGYCWNVDFFNGFGQRADWINKIYKSFLDRYWAEGANEYYCEKYGIDSEYRPESKNNCSFDLVRTPGKYTIDNLGHTHSSFSNDRSECGYFDQIDSWISFYPKHSSVELRFANLYTLESAIEIQVYYGDCSVRDPDLCTFFKGEGNILRLSNVPDDIVHVRIFPANVNAAFIVDLEIVYDLITSAENDICNDAIELVARDYCSFELYSTSGLTLSSINSPTTCSNSFEDNFTVNFDQWYKAVVPSSGELNFQMGSTLLNEPVFPYDLSVTNSNASIELYRGTCDQLEYISCSNQDFYTGINNLRPDIEQGDLVPGETVYFRVLLQDSDNTVSEGLTFLCLQEGLYYPENEYAVHANSIPVEFRECKEVQSANFRQVRNDIYDRARSCTDIEGDRDLWYTFKVPQTENFNIYFNRRETEYLAEHEHFSLNMYKVVQTGDQTALHYVICFFPQESSRGIYAPDLNLSEGDSMMLQVRFADYDGSVMYYNRVYDFELCIYDDTECQDEVRLSGLSTSIQDAYYSKNQIISNEIIPFGAIMYSAENGILLNQGFEVDQNSIFEATIQDCPQDNTGLSCDDPIIMNFYSNPFSAPGPQVGESNWFIYENTSDIDLEVTVSSCGQNSDTYLEVFIIDNFSCQMDFSSPDFVSDDYEGGEEVSCQTGGSYVNFQITEKGLILLRWRSFYSLSPFEFSFMLDCVNAEDCLE